MLFGTDVDDVVSKLERCTQASLEWANNNAVRFEESKTEAILFSNRRRHRQCRREIRVGSTHRVRFAGEATRWLGIWLDASQPRGEPSTENRKDTSGGGEATPDSQPVRRASSIGEEFAGRDCPGDDALRFGADLERPGQGRGTVPAGHQQDGKGNAGGPPVNVVGHHHGGERFHARQSPARPSTGPLRTAALRQAPGGRARRRFWKEGRLSPRA